MAQESNDRLDRIESLLLQLAESAVRHDNQLSRIEVAVTANTEAIASMRESHDQLINESVEWFGEVFTRIDEMQSEVRGLQTENRRILERLEQHMSNGHGD
jgi:predicted  nucleic acid-binding Zn-ribbon protein